MKLGDIVIRDAIATELSGEQRDEVITELVDLLIAAGAAPGASREAIVKAVLQREATNTTGFGKGVAVPHVKHKTVAKTAAAIGLSQRGIDFQSMDKQPVYSVFLLLSPDNRPEEHLQAMEAIFRNLSKETFRRSLRQAGGADDVCALIDEADGGTP